MAVDESLKAGRREWIGLAVLALPTFLVSIDTFVLLLALPDIARSLHAGSNQQLWITDIYGFMLAGFLVTMGTLGDRIGRRRLLLVGSAAFGVMSVVTAYAGSSTMLIVSRALLGVAGATLMPSTLALIATMFKDDSQRARAFGLWGGTFTLGAIVGPAIGGVLLHSFWWGSVFLLAPPVMVLLLVVGPMVLPEFRNEEAGRLDPLSVVLSLATMLPIIYGIKQLARDGWEVLPELTIIGGVAVGVVFGYRQLRLEHPILDVRLFQIREISTALISQLGYAIVGGGTMLFMMLYFQMVRGMSTLAAGAAMIPGMAAATLGFMVVTPYLSARMRPAYLIAAGMLGTAAVLAVFTQVSAASGTATLIIGFAVFSFCGSPLVALGTNLIVGTAPPEQAGSAGSMAQMSNEFGGTLGGALLGTIGFAVYRGKIDGRLPAGLTAHQAAQAKDSMAGATVTAGQVPHSLGESVLDPARHAFANGLHTVSAIGAVTMACVAVLIAVRLRHIPPIGSASPAPEGEADLAPAESAPAP